MTTPPVMWKVDGQRRTGAKGGRPKVLDKYTHRGTERIIREDEVKTPSEGFARQYGAERLASIRRLSSLMRKGETAEGVTLLRRTRAPGVVYTFAFQHQGRLTYVTLKGAEVVCFGCDPHAAAVHASRTEYTFEPDVDRTSLTLDEKLALTKRWAYQIKRHAAVIERMNYEMTFSPSAAVTARYRTYARSHGLRIKVETVDL